MHVFTAQVCGQHEESKIGKKRTLANTKAKLTLICNEIISRSSLHPQNWSLECVLKHEEVEVPSSIYSDSSVI